MSLGKCTSCGKKLISGDGNNFRSCLICGLLYCDNCIKYYTFCLNDFNQLSNEDKKYTLDLYNKSYTGRKNIIFHGLILLFPILLLVGYSLGILLNFLFLGLLFIFLLLFIPVIKQQLSFRKKIFIYLNKNNPSKIFSKNYKKLSIFTDLNLTKGKLDYYREKIKNFENKYGFSIENLEYKMNEEKFISIIKVDYNEWQKYIRYSKDLENKIEKIEIRLNSIN